MRLQASKLLGNRRKTYILDVICNRFYFEEVQEEVLGQRIEQGISAPWEECLSAYQWSVPEKKNKRGGWGNVFVNTLLKFLGLSWKFWKNEVHCKCDSIKCDSAKVICFFYWNSLIQKDVWAMKSSKWELYVSAKLLTSFKHLKGVSTFLLILDRKRLTYKISKERRIAIANMLGLDNVSSNLRIIILRSII